MQRIAVPRINREDSVIKPTGLVEPPGPMRRQRLLE